MPTSAWSIVVPVKRPEHAKTRLSDAVGELRPVMARAFAADTVAAALACPAVVQVVVVTDDDETGRTAREQGAVVVADGPDAGLNAALRHGAVAARSLVPDAGVAAMAADLPALRPEELSRVLEAAAAHPVAFVSDAAGIGTTLYAVAPGVEFAPDFGGRSRAAHRSGGAVEIDLDDVPSMRRDIDTPIDLWDAMRLGLGTHTESVIVHLDAAF
jgi:2-phospho-L-lactate/phosphoenolpyruvate guanylyltransferase